MSEVARRHNIRSQQLFGWRRGMRIVAAEPQTRFVPALVEAAEPGKLQRARSRLARTGRGDIELEIDGGGASR